MPSLIEPLNSNVPVTNPDGTPTPLLQRLLQKLQLNSGSGLSVVGGKLSLLAIPAKTLLANLGSSTAVPASASISQVLDILGAVQGSILYRDSTGWQVLAPGTSGQILETQGTGANPKWISGGSGGSGLYSGIMSATPTSTMTGLTNLVGTGAAIANTAAGQRISGTASAGAYTTTVPATPYSITALIAAQGGSVPEMGWTDLTKYQFMYPNPGSSTATFGQINVQSNSNLTTFAATNATFSNGFPLRLLWMKIRDDGTNVTWFVSVDGVNFQQIYTVAKSSGYLGASGYSHIIVGPLGSAGDNVIMSWTQGT